MTIAVGSTNPQYDGHGYHVGLSSVLEAPRPVMTHMLYDCFDMNRAALKASLTDNPMVGAAECFTGIMTKGRLDRKAATKESVRMALIDLE